MKKSILLLFVILISPLYSQLTLEIQPKNDGNIDITEFPLVKAYVKGYDGGDLTTLDKNKLLIMENGYTIEPISADYVGDWQEVIWITKRTEFSDTEVYYGARLYWSLNNEITYSNVAARYIDYPIMNVFSDNSKISDISFGNYNAGVEIPFVVKINAYRKKPFQSEESPVFLDSITNHSDAFLVEWMGSDSDPDWSPPPRQISPDSRYWLKITFKPKANEPYRDKLVLHYEGGFRKVIPLKGNSLKLPFESALKIIEPNGSEVFTPCEEVTIKWEGQSPTNPVIIHYSSNKGTTWEKIASVDNASEYIWKVPSTITDRALLKVSQEFDNAKEFLLSKDAIPLSNANYNLEGDKVVTINTKGKILEWDLLAGGLPKIRTEIQLNPNYDNAVYKSSGIYYTAEDEFAVHYRIISEPSYKQNDTIIYFKSGEENPIKKTYNSNDHNYSKIVSGFNYNYTFGISELGTQVQVISTKEGNIINTLDFNYPVRDISVSKNNELAVLLMNNEIKYYDINSNFSEIKSIKYPDLRWILNAQISPNGLFTAISEHQVTSGMKYSTYLVDNDSEILARQFTPAASEVVGLGFNSTSNILAIGSQNQPQVVLYDMTSSDSREDLPAHITELHKMVLSPSGKSILTLAKASSDNIFYRTFTYPEHDETDATFKIVRPVLSNDLISIEPDYLGHETEHLIVSIMNEGEKFIDLSDVKMQKGINFTITEWEKDTVYPGENAVVTLSYKPIETGILNDTILFRVCSYDLKVPVQSEGYPRNITYYNNPYDFGEVCVGETKESPVLNLLKNEDPVPLKLNNLRIIGGHSPFTVVFGGDTVIPAGATFSYKVSFRPSEISIFESKVEIFYADQITLTDTLTLRGEGIGASLDYSHERLLFIPEIPERQLTLTNSGDVPVSILNAFTEPEGYFLINSTFPINIEPGETADISIAQIEDTDEFVNLYIDADPCLNQKDLLLGKYTGTSYLSIPEVTVKPTEDVEIPVSFRNTENGKYNGVRRFEGEFSIYYKLFFPLEATSEFGDAEIYKNEVIGNKRIVGVRVTGEFTDEGVVATIKGKPGLTDILEDDLVLEDKPDIWGSSITNNYDNGKLIIFDEHITRVIKQSQMIEIGSISPNPADEVFTVNFYSEEDTHIIIEILNEAGQTVMKTDEIQVVKGNNEVSLNVNMLPVGSYNLLIKSNGEFTQKIIVISR